MYCKGNWEVMSTGSDDDSRVQVKNPNICGMSEDVLYHFALGTKTHDLKLMFGDVKFVCVGGSPRRMERFAQFMLKELRYNLPAGQDLVNIAGATDRYALYKVGPVLAASHGIGMSSFSIMMHELIKSLHYAEAQDVSFFRLGTSGGIGMEPGTVVVTDQAVDALLRPTHDLAILGKMVSRPAVLDPELADDLIACNTEADGFKAIKGKTMCTSDFYEGQARLDGAFCDYTDDDKMVFLRKIHAAGVRNIEMESLCFAAMCHRANIKGAVACVTLLDRLQGDQIDTPHEVLKSYDERPAILVARLIRRKLGLEE